MKCLFDNNLPPKLAVTLNYLEGSDGIVVKHMKEKFSSDTQDTEWINKLAEEGDWFVITRDNQIRKKPHERQAWQESHIPVVFLQKSWMDKDFWEIAWRFVKYWSNLKKSISQNNKIKSFELTINGKITVIEWRYVSFFSVRGFFLLRSCSYSCWFVVKNIQHYLSILYATSYP